MNIPGETTATYTLTTADVGRRIRVRVSFTDDLGNPETLTSAAYPSSGTVTAPATAACAAPSLSGRNVIWTGAMTVAVDPANAGVFGFESGSFGTLDDQTFTVGANDYTTRLVSLMGNALTFATTNSDLTAGDKAELRLHVCATDLDFSAATGPTVDHAYLFSTTGLSWSSGDTVTLRLSVPGFGVPQNFRATAGDTQVVLRWTAPASDGGTAITTYQYRYSGRQHGRRERHLDRRARRRRRRRRRRQRDDGHGDRPHQRHAVRLRGAGREQRRRPRRHRHGHAPITDNHAREDPGQWWRGRRQSQPGRTRQHASAGDPRHPGTPPAPPPRPGSSTRSPMWITSP